MHEITICLAIFTVIFHLAKGFDSKIKNKKERKRKHIACVHSRVSEYAILPKTFYLEHEKALERSERQHKQTESLAI